MMIRIRFLFCLALLLASAPLSTAFAQQPAVSAEEQNQSSTQKLDTLRAQLQQMEASLQRRDQADDALQTMRGALEPINDGLREAIDELTPRFETLKQRLDQLGPKPDAKAAPENPDAWGR
jgi:potassium-dependent mechanosensitive channel